MININDKFVTVELKNLALVFEIKRFYFGNKQYDEENSHLKYITLKYFGPKSEMKELIESPSILPPSGSNRDYNTDPLIFSYFGNGNNSEVSMIINNSDNSYTNRFFLKSIEVIDGGVDVKGPHTRNIYKTLDICEYDEDGKIEIHHYYSFVLDSDVIVSKKKVINLGDEDIYLNRLMSLELPIMNRELEVHTFDGAWLFERYRHVTSLNSGTFINQSHSGYSSHKHNPFFEVVDKTTNYIYAFNLIYSGNHKGIVDINPIEHTSVMIGINDFCFNYCLKANNGEFITPEAIFTMAENKDDITTNLHEFILNNIVNPNFIKKDRPILFNSWEGSAFNINEKNLLEMADVAKEVGIELFVIDDGWFKGRNNDFTSLGDWVSDFNKFPKGIGDFANKIHDKGLLFGIWVEPEMISMESDLFKAHPEYALRSEKRFPLERRHQLMIDMTNKEVIDYLYDSLSKIILETKADYVKWDFNRTIIDIYSSCGTRCGEYFHLFVMGLYELMERLTTNFPNVLFEGCSSGGGRFDLGIAYYFPQTWGSDNSNSSCRLRIASGTFEAYPISTFGSHVAREHFNDSPYYFSSLEDRFNVQAFGAFGYEFDVRTTNEIERNILKDQIKYFKEHRELFVYGDYFNIDNIFDDPRYCSFSTVSKTKDEAMLLVAVVDKSAPSKTWRFKNLNKDYIYEIKVRSQYNQQDYDIAPMSGDDLMNKGVDLGNFIDPNLENEEFQSRIIYIRKI